MAAAATLIAHAHSRAGKPTCPGPASAHYQVLRASIGVADQRYLGNLGRASAARPMLPVYVRKALGPNQILWLLPILA